MSDYEEGYAHNVAPKYIANSRRGGSRIPGPIAQTYSQESRDSSRQTSPDKRGTGTIKPFTTLTAPTKSSRGKATIRPASKEKAGGPRLPTTPIRPAPLNKRKTSYSHQGKVSTLARQYDRLSREADKQSRRFSVIRGRKLRPVASAKPKTVEVFDNVRDAILDESESSDASEADDEEDDRVEEEVCSTREDPELEQSLDSLADSMADSMAATSESAIPSSSSNSLKSPVDEAPISPPITIPDVNPPPPTPLPPGVVQSISSDQAVPTDPEAPGSLTDTNYFTRALSKFFPVGVAAGMQAINYRPQVEIEPEDPLVDPEHIFRESDIVVRTDEPTSIIALTLE